MDAALLIGRLLLAAVFGIAGLSKLRDRDGSARSMREFGVPAALATPFGTLLPGVEILMAAALLHVGLARAAAAGVLALLTLFIAGIAVNLVRGRAPQCHCFGQLHSEPVGPKTLVRNLVLAGIATAIVFRGTGPAITSIVAADPDFPTLLASVAVAIAAGALYLSAKLLRQNGRLLMRLEAVEAVVIPAAAKPSGLPVDHIAPSFSLRDLDGSSVTLEDLATEKKPLLLVFSEPGCGACDLLLPEVAGWQREYADRLSTVVISRGTVGQNRNKRAKIDLQMVLLQANREVADSYQVVGTPSAVLIENGRIGRQLAAGPDSIRTLVSDITALKVPKGMPVPDLRLTTLEQQPADLGGGNGRHILLLFWSPTCGYCQQMLDDIKAWEVNPPAGAPELVVLATGNAEDNKRLGFRSRVLLDTTSAAAETLGVTGTPSALLLDEQKRIASYLAVGRVEVMALANKTSRQ